MGRIIQTLSQLDEDPQLQTTIGPHPSCSIIFEREENLNPHRTLSRPVPSLGMVFQIILSPDTHTHSNRSTPHYPSFNSVPRNTDVTIKGLSQLVYN